MGFVFYVFLIAVLNIAVGYAVAGHLGLGPPSLAAGWRTLAATSARPAGDSAAETRETIDTLAAASLEDMLDESDFEELIAGASAEAVYDEDVAALIHEGRPDAWDLDEKYVETSILKLNIAMMRSGKRAEALDTRLRACQGRSTAETIRQCLAELLEDCEGYLAEQAEAAEKFRARIGELGELAVLGETIEMANLEQASQVETTINNLKFMDFESDLEAANRRLLEELQNLRSARHRLRDDQEKAFLAVARYEGRLGKIEPRLFNDPLTQLSNRIGVEATLHEWWRQKRHETRQLVGVLFDLDDFGSINDEHGVAVADRLLFQFAELLRGWTDTHDLVGRFAGQRFLVMLADAGPRAAVTNVERFRQQLSNTTFLHEALRIEPTVSAGVAAILPDDGDEAVFARLEETLAAARREAGRNASAFHDGRNLEFVEAPNLGTQPREIPL